ncbi:MAG: hypothetical protein EOM26_08385 [Alphaproteobacteria bacterium]|nr:hypothetical protein [Alphaproteobacteria bacterium]
MRTFLFALGTLCFLIVTASPAFAGPKPWPFGWWPSHWEDLDFERPYMHDGKSRHNTQWDYRGWQAEDWISQRDSGLQLIEGWYVAGILTDQYVRNKVPVLEVGSGFYDLGGFDKRRVVRVVDTVYGITAQDPNAIFRLRDAATKDYIGLYSRHGLMLE